MVHRATHIQFQRALTAEAGKFTIHLIENIQEIAASLQMHLKHPSRSRHGFRATGKGVYCAVLHLKMRNSNYRRSILLYGDLS